MCSLVAVACNSDHSDEHVEASTAQRTVIVYMAAENNLNGFAQANINDMIVGMAGIGQQSRLLIFADKASDHERPFIARLTGETTHPVDTLYKYAQDFNSLDPANMEEVLRRTLELSPGAQDYALVFWGHGSGWIVQGNNAAKAAAWSDAAESDVAGRRAYGTDNLQNNPYDGKNSDDMWMNIPELRGVLERVGMRWKFIFFDCCNMQSAEVAYELRGTAQYIIASPAEITGNGAPYRTLMNDFFNPNDQLMYTAVCDHYYAQKTNYLEMGDEHLPISTVDTRGMEALAEATRAIVPEIKAYVERADVTRGHVYYYQHLPYSDEQVMYDMADMIQAALANQPEKYEAWKGVMQQAVVYSRYSSLWHALHVRFGDFRSEMSPERFACISMFFPLTRYNNRGISFPYNQDIKRFQWYQALEWE